MMKSEVLYKAAEYVAKGWLQGSSGRNGSGEEVGAYAEDAISFCMMGAVEKCLGLNRWTPEKSNLYGQIHDDFTRYLDKHPIWWNDAPGRTQAEVYEALQIAAICAENIGE